MKRLKGQSIREVMGQVDVLTDRIVQKCKDPKEKEYKKNRIMIEALISFVSEENAKDLKIALKSSSLSGEDIDLPELIDSIEMAERLNEGTKPTKDLDYSDEGKADEIDINNMSYGTSNNQEKNKQMNVNKQMGQIVKQSNEISLKDTHSYNKAREKREKRDKSNDSFRGYSYRNRSTEGPRERLRSQSFDRKRSYENNGWRNNNRDRNSQTRDRQTEQSRDGYSQSRGRDRERNQSKDRYYTNYFSSSPGYRGDNARSQERYHQSNNWDRNQDRNNYNQSSNKYREQSKDRYHQYRDRGRDDSRDGYNQYRNRGFPSREQSRERNNLSRNNSYPSHEQSKEIYNQLRSRNYPSREQSKERNNSSRDRDYPRRNQSKERYNQPEDKYSSSVNSSFPGNRVDYRGGRDSYTKHNTPNYRNEDRREKSKDRQQPPWGLDIKRRERSKDRENDEKKETHFVPIENAKLKKEDQSL